MRLFEFINLLEYKRDITINRFGDKLVSAAMSDRKQNIDVILSTLEQIDPTKNKQYVEWLCRQYINKQFRLEDASRVNEVLVNFENLKRRLPQKDINRYTFYSLSDLIDKEMNVELGSGDDPEDAPVDGIKVLYDGPLGMLAIPETEEASKFLGRGTKWCTAANKDNQFERYSSYGPLYIWRDKNGKKYQFHFVENQFMDERDQDIDHELLTYFRTKHPVLSKLFKNAEAKIMDDPEITLEYITHVIKGRWPEAEPTILESPMSAMYYAIEVIQGRWPEAEPMIMQYPEFAAQYAEHAIQGRWPEAENNIMQDGHAAFRYASGVIGGRWPESEKYLKQDPGTWKMYQDFLNSKK